MIRVLSALNSKPNFCVIHYLVITEHYTNGTTKDWFDSYKIFIPTPLFCDTSHILTKDMMPKPIWYKYNNEENEIIDYSDDNGIRYITADYVKSNFNDNEFVNSHPTLLFEILDFFKKMKINYPNIYIMVNG